MRSDLPEISLRPAETEDLPGVADLYLRVRADAVPMMPAPEHTAAEVRAWVRRWDLRRQDVWVAEAAGRLLGYARAASAWLDDLYVDPAHQRAGIGTMLLELVRASRPDGFCLWVFESNRPARSFYRRHGLVELEHTDGSGNQERAPDLRVAWPGERPVTFFRKLVDEVDAELGELLARRAALTRAIQPYKSERSRDPERERAIARDMARRAPALGDERLARIMHVIITESLGAAEQAPPDQPPLPPAATTSRRHQPISRKDP